MNCNVKLCSFTKPINDLKDELKGSIFISICVVKHGHFEAGNLMICATTNGQEFVVT